MVHRKRNPVKRRQHENANNYNKILTNFNNINFNLEFIMNIKEVSKQYYNNTVKNGVHLNFRCALTQNTTKQYLYKFQRILQLSAYKYLKENTKLKHEEILIIIRKSRFKLDFDIIQYYCLMVNLNEHQGKNLEDLTIDIEY